MENKASIKRSHDPDINSELPDSKRSKYNRGLLDLSDCVLTLIFQYVHSFDLYALSLTCTRFNYLIPVKKLWSNVDVRSHRMCARKFKYFYTNLNDTTTKLMVSGINPNEKCITNFQFHRLGKITSNLSVLAMEYQLINSNEIQLRHFPAGLKELSLRGTHVEGCVSIFQEASVRLKSLHTLVLDECNWVGEHSLMALSKFSNLENLSVYKCRNLRDSIAYMSVTTRFGFKKLLRIDARLTKIGDQFLKCLNNLRSIREIYLEAPHSNGNAPTTTTAAAAAATSTTKRRNYGVKTSDQINRTSTFCLEEFRACDKVKCSFKPDDLTQMEDEEEPQQQQQQHNPKKTECGNVICVWPFAAGQNHENNDVRVHVLYGHEAPIEFERQQQQQQQQHQQQINDDFESDCDEDPNEILYNNNVCNYANDPSLSPPSRSPWFSVFNEDTVSDDGIRWFTASGTNSSDYLGQESLLFRRPFHISCDCVPTNDNWDAPGPSGINPQPPDVEPVISIRRLIDNEQNADVAAEEPIERRDLRVVIERVEPGVQIIVNNNNINNNNNNAMFQNNLTRLKVFVVRNFKRLTDRAMLNLSGIRLEVLDITRTSISADAVKRFLLLNPDCRVIHESTCRCIPPD